MKNISENFDKNNCCGCEACVQVCPQKAVCMKEDGEGFRYPEVNFDLCVDCGLCRKICQYIESVEKNTEEQLAFGGHINDSEILNESTSGGAFSAIADCFCDENYVIFGAESKGCLSFLHNGQKRFGAIPPFKIFTKHNWHFVC